MLRLYRRHIQPDADGLGGCKHAAMGVEYKTCSCPIWVDGMHAGQRVRYSLDTFNWAKANSRLHEIEADKAPMESTVVDAVKDYLDDAARRGLKESGTKKYRELLNALLKFCEGRALTTVRAIDVTMLKKFVYFGAHEE
jgi:hypothetical protein